MFKLFNMSPAQDSPVGARCSVHPGGRGGGAVYVDLSMAIRNRLIERESYYTSSTNRCRSNAEIVATKLWRGEVVRALDDRGRARASCLELLRSSPPTSIISILHNTQSWPFTVIVAFYSPFKMSRRYDSRVCSHRHFICAAPANL
jgi:hypothetical protein